MNVTTATLRPELAPGRAAGPEAATGAPTAPAVPVSGPDRPDGSPPSHGCLAEPQSGPVSLSERPTLSAGPGTLLRRPGGPRSTLPGVSAGTAPLVLNAPTLAAALGPLGRRPRDLTGPERETLTLLAQGHGAKGIARRLCVSDRTVKTRLSGAYEALGATNGAHAVALAHLRGLLDTEPVDASTNPRRLQILILVARGETNAGIGRALWVSEQTVKSHVGHLFVDLGAVSRPNLVHRGFGCGALGVARRDGDAS